MNTKIVLLTLLAASGAGAWYHFHGGRSPIQRVMERPKEIPSEGYGGIVELAPGADVTACREKGRTTVFVFTARKSSECRKLEQMIGQFIYVRPDVAFRFVDLTDLMEQEGDWRGYLGVDVGKLPHVMIYDRKGRLVAGDDRDDRDGLQLMYDWISREHQHHGSTVADGR